MVVHSNSPTRIAVTLGLLFGLAACGTSAVAVALPDLGAGLGVGTSGAAWVISGYTVLLAVATAVHGRIADLVGIRLPLVIGVGLMALGALGSALAPSFGVLMAARVVQGFGAASVPVLGMALVTALWDGHQRAAALGRIAGVTAAVSASGPVIGGLLDTVGGWRWTLTLPIVGLAALPLILRVAPRTGNPGRFDVLGAVAVAGGAAGLVLLVQSPATGPVVALVGLTLLLGCAPVAVWRVRTRPEGFLPRDVITHPVVLRSAFGASVVPAAWFALLVAVPTVLGARGWSALQVGLLLLPAVVVSLMMPRVVATLLDRRGASGSLRVATPTALVAVLVAALGGLLSSAPLLVVSILLVTVAFGIGQPSMIAAVGAAVAPERRGVAMGVAMLIFLVGAGVGAAVVGGLLEPWGAGPALLTLALLPAAGTVLLMGRLRRL